MKIDDSVSANERLARELKTAMGANARRIRQAAGATLEDFAEAIRHQGLNWSTGRVGDLDGGRVEAKLSNAVAVAQTLANVTGQPVTLADLFADTEFEALFRGEPLRPQGGHGHDPDASPLDLARRNGWENLAQAAADFGVPQTRVTPYLIAFDSIRVTDRRAAKALGLSLMELTTWAVRLWDHSLTTERDRRAGPDADVSQLGSITRQLRDEIEARS